MELSGRGHEVDRAGKAFLQHIGVYMFDGLAEPGELKPDPLFVVVKLNFLASFVIGLFLVLLKLFQDK